MAANDPHPRFVFVALLPGTVPPTKWMPTKLLLKDHEYRWSRRGVWTAISNVALTETRFDPPEDRCELIRELTELLP